VTNVTFTFETSPTTNPKRKKWGDMAYYVPPSKKVGDTRPPCPPPNWNPWFQHQTTSGLYFTVSSLCYHSPIERYKPHWT